MIKALTTYNVGRVYHVTFFLYSLSRYQLKDIILLRTDKTRVKCKCIYLPRRHFNKHLNKQCYLRLKREKHVFNITQEIKYI